jgi:putative peptidoglycan lipid II flippase
VTETGTLSPVDRTLRHDTLVVTLCTLLARITGFGRVLATAAVLGSGALGDVYHSANLLPNLLFELAAGGVLQAVLVPAFVAARRDGGVEGLASSASALSGQVLAALGLLTLGFMVLTPLIARAIVAADPSASSRADKLDVLVPMLLVFLPQIVCYGMGALAASALAAQGRYVAAALAPAANNVVVIAACLAFRAVRDGAVTTLQLTPLEFALIAGGTTLGVVVYSFVPAAALWAGGITWRPRWEPDHRSVQALRSAYKWAALTVLGTFLPTLAALGLGNATSGGVAIFIFAFAFFSLPHALVAVPMATTLAPRVAEHWQAGDRVRLRTEVSAGVDVMLPMLTLAAAGMLALAWPVARAFAFGQIASEGITPIAHALMAFAPGLLTYGVSFVMVRLLLAVDDVRGCAVLMVWSGIIGVVVLTIVATSIDRSDRPAALALGYGLAQGLAALLLTQRFRRITGAPASGALVRPLLEALVAGGAAVAVMLAVGSTLGESRTAAGVEIVVGGSAGVAVFVAVLALLRGGHLRRTVAG